MRTSFLGRLQFREVWHRTYTQLSMASISQIENRLHRAAIGGQQPITVVQILYEWPPALLTLITHTDPLSFSSTICVWWSRTLQFLPNSFRCRDSEDCRRFVIWRRAFCSRNFIKKIMDENFTIKTKEMFVLKFSIRAFCWKLASLCVCNRLGNRYNNRSTLRMASLLTEEVWQRLRRIILYPRRLDGWHNQQKKKSERCFISRNVSSVVLFFFLQCAIEVAQVVLCDGEVKQITNNSNFSRRSASPATSPPTTSALLIYYSQELLRIFHCYSGAVKM